MTGLAEDNRAYCCSRQEPNATAARAKEHDGNNRRATQVGLEESSDTQARATNRCTYQQQQQQPWPKKIRRLSSTVTVLILRLNLFATHFRNNNKWGQTPNPLTIHVHTYCTQSQNQNGVDRKEETAPVDKNKKKHAHERRLLYGRALHRSCPGHELFYSTATTVVTHTTCSTLQNLVNRGTSFVRGYNGKSACKIPLQVHAAVNTLSRASSSRMPENLSSCPFSSVF